MGNLSSCVSCNVSKEKKSHQLSLGEVKDPQVKEIKDVADSKSSLQDIKLDTRDEPQEKEQELLSPRGSALELYNVLKPYKLTKSDRISEEEEELGDIDKAAKGIVDMSLLLTTRVIYPAYMRYLEEDHPDLYVQYFARPAGPVPPYSLTDVQDDTISGDPG